MSVTGDRIGWYVRRLRRMSPAEVVDRGVDAARKVAWRHRQVLPGADPPAIRSAVRPFRHGLGGSAPISVQPAARDAVIAEADRILGGRLTLLGVERDDLQAPDYFRDPVTGRRWEPAAYAFSVPYRDEAKVGNVKQIWELSRLHHLTVVAAAAHLSGDAAYSKYVDDQLRSWSVSNPFLSGINWTSGIEAGIRLLNLVWIRRLLDGWEGAPDLFENNEQMLCQLAWHQHYLAGLRSRGSSGNNHLIAETAGSLAAACAFPWFPQSRRWRHRAAAELSAALEANTFPSGLNRELASGYHGFVAELGLLAGVEADLVGEPLSEDVWRLLTRMLDAAAAVVDARGRHPRQGDDDDGRVLVVDGPPAITGSWLRLLGLGGELVGALPWWPQPAPSVLAAVVGAVAARHPQSARPERRPDTFPDAGLVLLRTPGRDRPEIWCRCDSGPHGHLSIAAHAHADALSVEVRYDGVDVLADPGTYCYHGEPEWRRHFRSTAAHNTVTVGGEDSAVSGGPFLWSVHPTSTTLRTETDAGGRLRSWYATHDGYRRLGALHIRGAELHEALRSIDIVDSVAGPPDQPITMTWQLGPDVAAELQGPRARLRFTTPGGERCATLRLPPELDWIACTGQLSPRAGWYSPSFGRVVAATVLLGTGRPGTHTTRLEFDL